MRRMSEEAYAKINLTLDVVGKRPDGYHEMVMVMQSVSLTDTLTITLDNQPGVRVSSNHKDVPTDESNLAYQAGLAFLEEAELYKNGISIEIDKRIPVMAGTAGGSSDAAATLRCLNTMSGKKLPVETLMKLGAKLGSDVPFCIEGGTALVQGRGERVRPIWSMPPCYIVLCKPNFGISTAQLFERLDEISIHRHPDTQGMLRALQFGDLIAIGKHLHNVFEDVLERDRWEEVMTIRRVMVEMGAMGSSMSGSGPTVFGIFETEENAWAVVKELRKFYRSVFLTQPV